MELNLPPSAFVNKFIPKSKFFGKAIINTKLKNELADKIQKITWKYKLSESTINTPKTELVEEIQIFEIELKQQVIPTNILKIIDKTIPYPILYLLKFGTHHASGMALKNDSVQSYYFSEWDEDKQFDFTGINLERIYEKLIKNFITKTDTVDKEFKQMVETDQKIKVLEKEIEILKNKIRRETQFNKKVELNTLLQKKENELKNL